MEATRALQHAHGTGAPGFTEANAIRIVNSCETDLPSMFPAMRPRGGIGIPAPPLFLQDSGGLLSTPEYGRGQRVEGQQVGPRRVGSESRASPPFLERALRNAELVPEGGRMALGSGWSYEKDSYQVRVAGRPRYRTG